MTRQPLTLAAPAPRTDPQVGVLNLSCSGMRIARVNIVWLANILHKGDFTALSSQTSHGHKGGF